LLVPIDDAPRLATAIRRLIEQPDLARKLAEAGRKAYEADYVEAKIVDRYLAFYEALVKTR
jgi:glycosyltransferase involved in cell wall biosynthesis